MFVTSKEQLMVCCSSGASASCKNHDGVINLCMTLKSGEPRSSGGDAPPAAPRPGDGNDGRAGMVSGKEPPRNEPPRKEPSGTEPPPPPPGKKMMTSDGKAAMVSSKESSRKEPSSTEPPPPPGKKTAAPVPQPKKVDDANPASPRPLQPSAKPSASTAPRGTHKKSPAVPAGEKQEESTPVERPPEDWLQIQEGFCRLEDDLRSRVQQSTNRVDFASLLSSLEDRGEGKRLSTHFEQFKDVVSAAVALNAGPPETNGISADDPSQDQPANRHAHDMQDKEGFKKSLRMRRGADWKVHVQVECRSRLGAWAAVIQLLRNPEWKNVPGVPKRGGFFEFKMLVGNHIQSHLWQVPTGPTIALYCSLDGVNGCTTLAVQFAHAFYEKINSPAFKAVWGDLTPMMYLPPRYNIRLTDYVYMSEGDGQNKNEKQASKDDLWPKPPVIEGRPHLVDFRVAEHIEELKGLGKPPAIVDGWVMRSKFVDRFKHARAAALEPFKEDEAFMAQTEDPVFGFAAS